MRERSLIERIRQRRADTGRSSHENPSLLADSVLGNLRQMLNTRQGISCTVPDFGIPDLADLVHSFPEAIDLMRRSIVQCVEKYEPRLRNVSAIHVADPNDIFHIKFEIRGELVTGRDKTRVAFRTTLDATGKADIRR